MIRARTAALLAALVAAAGSACSDSSGPVGGTLKVHLTMPSANSGLDGALLLTVKGPVQLSSARAGSGLRMFYQAFGTDSTRFAVTGTLSNDTDILLIGVEDVRPAKDYTARVDQVAATAGYALRASLTGYNLEVRPLVGRPTSAGS